MARLPSRLAKGKEASIGIKTMLASFYWGRVCSPRNPKRKESEMAETKTKEEILAEMNEAASQAAKDFEQVIVAQPQGVRSVAGWWETHYRTCGHKRLARILLAVGGE